MADCSRRLRESVSRYAKSGDLFKAFGDIFRSSDVPSSWVPFCEDLAPLVAQMQGSSCILRISDLFEAISAGYGSSLTASNPCMLVACLLRTSKVLVPEAVLIQGAELHLAASSSPASCTRALPGLEEAVSISRGVFSFFGVNNTETRFKPDDAATDGSMMDTLTSMMGGLGFSFSTTSVSSADESVLVPGPLTIEQGKMTLVYMPQAIKLSHELELSLQALPCPANILASARGAIRETGTGPTATGAYILVEPRAQFLKSDDTSVSGLKTLSQQWVSMATGAKSTRQSWRQRLHVHVQPLQEESIAVVLAGIIDGALRVCIAKLPSSDASISDEEDTAALCVLASKYAGADVIQADVLLSSGASQLATAQALDCSAATVRQQVKTRVTTGGRSVKSVAALPASTKQYVISSLRRAKALDALAWRMQRSGDVCWQVLETRSAAGMVRDAATLLREATKDLPDIADAIDEQDDAMADAIDAIDAVNDRAGDVLPAEDVASLNAELDAMMMDTTHVASTTGYGATATASASASVAASASARVAASASASSTDSTGDYAASSAAVTAATIGNASRVMSLEAALAAAGTSPPIAASTSSDAWLSVAEPVPSVVAASTRMEPAL